MAIGVPTTGSHPRSRRAAIWLLAALVLVTLTGAPRAEAASKTTATTTQVYFIRGFMGVFSTGFDTMAKTLAKSGVTAKVYGHLSGAAIRSAIVEEYAGSKRNKPVILVGHSFGGNAALQVAAGLRRDNIPVALVVTVDPTRGGPLSTNVGRYVNFFFSGNGLGSRLKSAPGVPQSRITNIDMGERDEVAGAGDDHWTVTHNAVIQSEILKLVKRAAR
ncbi:alpha/beta fold hydrolase [Hoeflea alexandrii]|uniref:Alpha/beta fold hydrolase n=1 Tax=Hoeflea alexandrii TaxID=288436 RepID=A0ABT1CRG7_9HYPH|nr:alpha/beta fold hydrolase [Hoeflea alexandrii]MCO6407961.1 alpha/beta fold hydrolase [Hoeflea alexandrii]MCY0153690.1 alpha/beta fold hydrolase [Hoeflea alexandrii]